MKFYTTLKMFALLCYCSTLSCSCGKHCSAPAHCPDTGIPTAVPPLPEPIDDSLLSYPVIYRTGRKMQHEEQPLLLMNALKPKFKSCIHHK